MRTHIATENGGSAVSIAHGQCSALMPSQMQSPPSPTFVPHGSTYDPSMAISNAYRSFCKTCSLAKLQAQPSFVIDTKQNIPFLQRIQSDICGPIKPECGPFQYFMVLVDASTRWSHVVLLSTRNVAFVIHKECCICCPQGMLHLLSTRNAAFTKLLAQIIKLRAHRPDYTIKSIRLDNAGEFTSKYFDDYCMSIGIDVEHPVLHVHSQNGLAEATIKRLQLVARALVMRTNLPVSAWGYAILHAAVLICFRPTAKQHFSAYQLVTRYESDISYLHIFDFVIYVPITPPLRDLFTARFEDCHFDETYFPSLGGERNGNVPVEQQELSWSVPTTSHYDPRTSQSEIEVQRILDLQKIVDSMPDSFKSSA
ncbi:hypothetical protein ACLB2K_077161 [Fragaria x ananassa]